MHWSREGLDPNLQIRAAIASVDWRKKFHVQSLEIGAHIRHILGGELLTLIGE
tara:strand:- start:382 stop:540 length:159 start_codon:yes stop_codon:yes gene_type:complete